MTEVTRRNRYLLGVVLSLGLAAALFVAVSRGTCSAWKERYKRFEYSQLIETSPIIFGPETIERIIGERPDGCAVPKGLTHADVRRFRAEGVGPDYFDDELARIPRGIDVTH